MRRLIASIILWFWLVGLSSISSFAGDFEYPIETWIMSFSLPILSILYIGIWYDTGRYLLGETIDSKESTVPVWIRSMAFITWISIILTMIVHIHIKLEAIPMLVMIPILGVPLQRWLFSFDGIFESAELEPILSKKELITLLSWYIVSPLTYGF